MTTKVDLPRARGAPPTVLSIAGSDPSGGAGIQADLKTFSALRVYGAAVVSALTAQNTRGVLGIRPVPADFVALQIESVASDLSIDAVKIGMLATEESVSTVARLVRTLDLGPLVLDPVLAASDGERLLHADAVPALRRELIPLARVLTPNYGEAAELLGIDVEEVRSDPEGAARALLDLRCEAVLLTGGHSGAERCDDLLASRSGAGGVTRLAGRRVATNRTHGTGCVLSAALAAHLALGEELEEAARAAKRFVTAAIESADSLAVGAGNGPIHPLHSAWKAGRTAEVTRPASRASRSAGSAPRETR